LRLPGATLAIGHTSTLAPFGGAHVASAAANRSAIIEFHVADVDAAYQRLADFLGAAVVQPPTTMPWATARCYFATPTATWSTSSRQLPQQPFSGLRGKHRLLALKAHWPLA